MSSRQRGSRSPQTDDLILSVNQFASDLPDKFLHCRELGHSWRYWTAEPDSKTKTVLRSLRCSSCRTIRKEVIDASGDAVKRSYDHAPGYLATNVEKGVKGQRSIFRIEAVMRQLTAQQQKAG